MAIGAIEIQMLADLSRLRKDMTDAQGVIGGAMNGIKGFVTGAMGALAGALTVGGFAAWIKGAVDAADEASKLAKSAGIATQDVAGLKLAFDLGGVGADSMGRIMGKLSKEISDGSAVFDTLGVKTRNADGSLRSTKDVLYDTADAFQAMGESTLTTAKAIEIFGTRIGADMVPMLLDGSDGLKQMAEMAADLGLVIDEETGAAAEQFNDTLDLLGSVSGGVATQIMAQMLPALNDMAGSMLDSVRNGDLVSKTADGIGMALKALYSVLAGVIGGLSAFGTYLGGLAAAVVQLSQGEFKQAWTTLNEGWADAGSVVKATAKTIEDAWTGTGSTTVEQAVVVNKALTGTTQTTKDYEAATKAAEKASKDAATAAAKQAEADMKTVADLAKTRSDARQAEGKAIADWERSETERRNKEVRASQDALAAAQLEYDTQGMLRSEIAALTLLRLLDKQAAFAVGSANYEAVQLEIQAQQELVAVLQKGEARDASAAAAKEAASEWQKTSDQIGQGLTDSLFRAFESGKDFFSVFWSGVKNLFKTTVLQLLIKPVQTAITGTIGSMFSGSAMAGTGGGGLDIGGIGSLISGAGSLGTIFGTGASMAVTGGFGSAMGSAGAMMNAGMYGSGAAMGLGAVAPYALAAYALYEAFKHEVTPHMGSVVSAGAGGVGTRSGDASTILNNFDDATDTALRAITGGSVGILNDLSAAFGGAGGFSAVSRFSADGNDASIGQYILRNGSGALTGYVGSGTPTGMDGGQYAFYSSDKEQAYGEFMQDVAGATRDALDAINLPKWASDMFAQLGDSADMDAIQNVTNAVRMTQQALIDLSADLRPLGGVFDDIASLSGDAALELANMVGGIDELRRKSASFVSNYYTQGEQGGIAAKQIIDALAAVGIDASTFETRSQFREYVDWVGIAGTVENEGGRRQLAALLNVSDQFAGLTGYLEETGLSLGELAAMAPETNALQTLVAEDTTRLATATEDIAANSFSLLTIVTDLVESVQAGLAATTAASNATTRMLESWDGGGYMVTSEP